MSAENRNIRRNLLIIVGIILILFIGDYFLSDSSNPEFNYILTPIFSGIFIATAVFFLILLVLNIVFIRRDRKKYAYVRHIRVATYIFFALTIMMTISCQNFSPRQRAKILFHEGKQNAIDGNLGIAERQFEVAITLDPETEYREDIDKWLDKINRYWEDEIEGEE